MNVKIYRCYKCGNEFHSDVEPKKVVEKSKFIGFICKKCLEKHNEEILRSYKCIKCNFPFKEVKPHNIKTEVNHDQDIWLKMDYICPKCSSFVTIKRKIGGIGNLEINSAMLERYTDKSIKKIYDLYREGFEIISKELHFNRKQTNYKITLAKGNNTKKLEFSEVSREFSYFWAQIQFVYDTNFQRIPTLIEPNKYWKKTVIPQRFDNVLIEISGYSFTEFEILDLPEEKTQNPLFRFEISFVFEENKNFFKVDFREPLSFYKEDQLLFKGFIITLMKGHNHLRVICQGLSGELIADKLNISIQSKNKRYLEFMAFLLDYFEKPYQIEGLDTEERLFEIIIPLTGLNISDKLKIGDCYIRDTIPMNEFLNEQNFPENGNFAYLSLNRASFYDALIDGLKYIKGAIDLVNFKIKIPTFLDSYHYLDQRAEAKLRDFVYLIDKKHETELVFVLPINQVPEYKRKVLIQDFFNPILRVGNNLIKPNKGITNEKENLLWILHYLMSAESKPNRTEAFLDLYIAFEFTLNLFGVKIEKRFSNHEIKEIRSYCNEFLPKYIGELGKLVNEGTITENKYKENKERYELIHKRLIQLINSNFNQPSINDQLQALVSKYELDLSEKEKKFFRKARQKRNDIIHGKESVKPTKQEYNILSKIIYFVIRNALISSSK